MPVKVFVSDTNSRVFRINCILEKKRIAVFDCVQYKQARSLLSAYHQISVLFDKHGVAGETC